MLAKGHRRTMIALALALAVPVMAQAGQADCTGGTILAGNECVARDRVESRIDEIVRKAMAEKDLKAVIAGVAVDGEPVLTEAWGVSMTGVPATPDMHFRNGAVAIAYSAS